MRLSKADFEAVKAETSFDKQDEFDTIVEVSGGLQLWISGRYDTETECWDEWRGEVGAYEPMSETKSVELEIDNLELIDDDGETVEIENEDELINFLN